VKKLKTPGIFGIRSILFLIDIRQCLSHARIIPRHLSNQLTGAISTPPGAVYSTGLRANHATGVVASAVAVPNVSDMISGYRFEAHPLLKLSLSERHCAMAMIRDRYSEPWKRMSSAGAAT